MKHIALIAVLALGGCTGAQVTKIQDWSANYQASIASINASIAASAPVVARVCGDLQTVVMLLAPLVPQKAKAPQYFAAGNGALQAYCQAVPSDVAGTAQALAQAYAAAKAGYDQVK